jgi:adenine-specific DNA-methyltransferase
VDLSDPYLGGQLIAYIGNKRALLPFIHDVLSRLPVDPGASRFLDPFAGSGAVSRLARAMGYRVAANDWEPYSFVINSCHLALTPSDLGTLFGRHGGIQAIMDGLNALPPPSEAQAYISRHFAPRSTDRADWRAERLFYTRENALAIDAIRQRIEDLHPGDPSAGALSPKKAALLAPLLYEAATHTNTSGVFKAYHKGFGGHGGDALGRIMGPVRMRAPVLIESRAGAEVTCMDAAAFLASRPAEICYLDPPYSTHQYGSNYFMLNTIARWDRPPVSGERAADGRLRRKAGIREDWTRTRSAFCYPASAAAAMREVVRAADCEWLVVSYSDEGLIGLEEMCDLLAETGALSVESRGYAKYRGGRQSLRRTTRNVELALVVHRGAAARVDRRARRAIADVRVARLMSLSFHPSRIRREFAVKGGSICLEGGPPPLLLPMEHFWRFSSSTPAPRFPAASAAERFEAALARCAVRDAREEIDLLVSLVERIEAPRERNRVVREMIRLLNRLAHPKYRAEFAHSLALLRGAAPRLGGSGSFLLRLEEVSSRAERRLMASPRGHSSGLSSQKG